MEMMGGIFEDMCTQSFDLEDLYNKVAAAIVKVDFTKLWEGFKPLKFALYDETKCFFDGAYVEKTREFCANTAIEYKGEMIAIWNVQQEMPITVFASKIIHEMFHGFQEMQGWECRANEMEALYRYRYSEENLTVKLHENRLLLDMLEGTDAGRFKELLACRKYRSERFPYEFSYECCGEEIEGSANYVEWQVLRQLDENEAEKVVADMRKSMLQPKYFFPIRISGYYTGALLINAMIQAGGYDYGPKERPVIDRLLETLDPVSSVNAGTGEEQGAVSAALSSFVTESKQIVETSVEANEVVLTGPVEMGGVNIYDARCYDGYLTSRFFLMYIENGEKKIIYDNYVIKMKDETTIEKVYRWK